MTEPIAVYEQIQNFARPFVEPLYLQDFLFRTGRSATTTTATGTFLQRKGQLYCVTCRHVVEGADSPKLNHETSAGVLALALDSAAIILGRPGQSCFASPTPAIHQPCIDIALACISWGDWETLKSHRNQLSYIDFDNFEEPNYSQFISCAGVGFPNGGKMERGGRIKVDLAVVVAGVTRPIDTNDAVFQLHSELNEPHGVGFSGMSGGLIVGIVSPDQFVPIGIIFEGGPSGQPETESPFAGPRDIFLRCHLLTPQILDLWVERITFPDVQSMFMAVVE